MSVHALGLEVTMNDVTLILNALERGDDGAVERLLPAVFQELRQLAAHQLAHERPGHTLQATALVHEAYLAWWGRILRASRAAAIFLGRPRKRCGGF